MRCLLTPQSSPLKGEEECVFYLSFPLHGGRPGWGCLCRTYPKIVNMILHCHFEATQWLRNLDVTRHARFLTCVRNDILSLDKDIPFPLYGGRPGWG